MRISRYIAVFVILATGCSDTVQDPLPDLDSTQGIISGTVKNSQGEAVAGAEVFVQPGDMHAISSGEGLFEVEVAIEADEAAYTIEVGHEDFGTVTGAVTLTRSNPDVVFDVELPLRDEDPPLETLDIAQRTPPGPWNTGPTIDFMIDVLNQGPASISNLVIVDTLDAEFGHEIGVDDITINEEQFPSAIVTLGSNGRSFQIELGEIDPTQEPVRAFNLRIPTPQAEGVFCNRVLANGDVEGEEQTDIEINCLVN